MRDIFIVNESRYNMNQKIRIKIENVLIFFIIATSFFLLILSFIPSFKVPEYIRDFMEIKNMVQRAFSIILLALSIPLFKRIRMAWRITLIILSLDLLHNISNFALPIHRIIGIMDIVIIAFLLCFQSDFCCPSSRKTRKNALIFVVLSLFGIIVNATISYHYIRLGFPYTRSRSIIDSFFYSINILLGMNHVLSVSSKARHFEDLMFWFSWGCMLAAILYVVKPWIHTKKSNTADIWHARELLNRYSQNSCSYLALEDDKNLFFGRKVDGVIPYGIAGSTVLVNGDPICADEDFPVFLNEFKEFCQNSAHNMIFLSVTDYFLEEYHTQGFGSVKCGEEARFLLTDYEISGKKGAKMRMNINHAVKAGITVHEYRVNEKRDLKIEQAFHHITQEWLNEKRSALLQFTLGSVGLENPMDKRYFYGMDTTGNISAFIVFVPFLGKNGYMADVTRHGADSPSGIMETIMYQAFQQFKEEGIAYGSLGVAPLAGLEENSSNPIEKLLQFVYKNLNECYGFRDLYRAKEKYSPTDWLPAYYVYLPKIPTPKMFYAVAKIQNPKGLRDYAKSLIKGKMKKIFDKDPKSEEKPNPDEKVKSEEKS